MPVRRSAILALLCCILPAWPAGGQDQRGAGPAEGKARGGVSEPIVLEPVEHFALPASDFLWPNEFLAGDKHLVLMQFGKNRVLSLDDHTWLEGELKGERVAQLSDKGDYATISYRGDLRAYRFGPDGIRQVQERSLSKAMAGAVSFPNDSPVWGDDPNIIAFVTATVGAAGKKKHVRLVVLDARSGQRVREFPGNEAKLIFGTQLLFKGSRLLAIGNAEEAMVFDLARGQPLLELPKVELKPGKFFQRTFAANEPGTLLAAHAGWYIDGSGPGILQCFDLVKREMIWSIDLRQTRYRPIKALGFTRDGKHLIVNSGKELVFFAARTGEIEATAPTGVHFPFDFSVRDDGVLYVLATEATGRKKGEPRPGLHVYRFKLPFRQDRPGKPDPSNKPDRPERPGQADHADKPA